MDDKKLYKIVKSFRHGLIGRKSSDFMCHLVCLALQGYLKYENNLDTRLVEGYCKVGDFKPEHVWLELQDKRIIDPTIDQFGHSDKVYIGDKPDNYLEE